MSENSELRCSFCGKSSSQVRRIIVGPDIYICNECVDLCKSIIDEETMPATKTSSDRLPKPEEIKAELDRYVIEQDPAKKSLAVAVYNHYKRIRHLEERRIKGKRGGAFKEQYSDARTDRLGKDTAGTDTGQHT